MTLHRFKWNKCDVGIAALLCIRHIMAGKCMKTSVSFFTFSKQVDILEACRQVKDAGYDGVELCLSLDGQINMRTASTEIAKLRCIIEDMELSISSIGAWNNWSYNIASPDRKIAAMAIDVVKREIEIASMLGTDTILLVPGWVGTRFSQEIVSYDVAYENAGRRIADLAAIANQSGIAIALENAGTKFLLSPLEFCRFIDDMQCKNIGAYFDVGNIIGLGYPEQWIRILGNRIRRLHFCDSREEVAGLNRFVGLFEGDVDFASVMDAVREIGYNSWITVEFLPNYKYYPYQSIRNARHSLERILAEC